MTQLAQAHITAQERLRALIRNGVAQAWAGLPGYDERNVAQWLATVLPLVNAGQRQSVALTEAFLARALGGAPVGVDAAKVVAGVRTGATPAEVYRRPFVTVWTALKAGDAFTAATRAGGDRATSAAVTDVQLAHRATLQAVQDAEPRIRGYRRVPDGGACAYCVALEGAIVRSADAAPLHPGCGCGFEPIVDASPRPASLPDEVAVHEHGELGALVGAAGDNFTSPADLP